MAGSGGKVIQMAAVTGFALFGEVTLVNELLLHFRTGALGGVFYHKLCKGRRSIPLQSGPDIYLADTVFKKLADLIVRYRRCTVQANFVANTLANCSCGIAMSLSSIADGSKSITQCPRPKLN